MSLKPRKLPTSPAIQEALAPDLGLYDRVVVAFSGGKDSLACLLELLEQGVDLDRVELWHHDVDGEGPGFMDWPITPAYCREIARHFGVPIYFSWKEGGFLRELLRDGERTAPISWEEPLDDSVRAGLIPVVVRSKGGTRGKLGTRLKFPQKGKSLSTRWCSGYLKIDVARRILSNDPRFARSSTLVVTGERAQESPGRARYKVFEVHESDNRKGRDERLVDRWRPVHAWKEERVWSLIERYKVRPHPAYSLGWGRCSCAGCIFGNADQWASFRAAMPERYEQIALLEEEFGYTIDRRLSVRELAAKGTPYPETGDDSLLELARATEWPARTPITMKPWQLPAGAFGDSTGPT